MSVILLTGGAGYIGSVCCRQLLEHGHEVIVIDDLSTGHVSNVPDAVQFHRIDYGDRNAVRAVLNKTRPIGAVFHFAAKALIPESVSNPGVFFRANVASGIALLETLREFGIKRFVFSSSAAVYGNPRRIPILETDATDPVNAYGETKLMFERVLHWYTTAYGWSIFAFRYFNASGATSSIGEQHNPETHIIPLLLQTAAGEREYFEIYGDDYETPDGTCVRDYVHVSDIAAAHSAALDAEYTPGIRIYNIGYGHGYSVREVIRTAEEVTGRSIPVHVSKRRMGDPAVLCANSEKLSRELGWKPNQPDLQEIIRSAWNWRQTQSRPQAA